MKPVTDVALGEVALELEDLVMHFGSVRAVDGVAATDGVVAVADGSFFLVTANGRRVAVRYLPAALRQKVGARVFVAGALDGEAASYGVIRERP